MRKKSIIKFAAYGAIGVLAFFVPIGGRVPIDYVIDAFVKLTSPALPYVVACLCFYAVLMDLHERAYGRSPADAVFFACKAIGLVLAAATIVGADGGYFVFAASRVSMASMGRTMATLFCIGIFLPFLLTYGLVEAVGVLASPLMRRAFRVPGTTTVVAVGALLGNFSIGLIGTEKMYDEGKLTRKESAIVATGFSTISIGLMFLIAQQLGMSAMFPLYFFTSILVTLLVTAITIRLPPLRRVKDEYKEGVEPNPEKTTTENKFKAALALGAFVAEKADAPWKVIPRSIGSTLKMLAGMVSSVTCIMTIGLVLNEFTDAFKWIGSLFYLPLKLFDVGSMEPLAKALGLSTVDVIASAAYGASQDLTRAARYVLAVVQVSTIIFLSGYLPCLFSTKLPIPKKALPLLWLERMTLSVFFACVLAKVIF